MLAMLNNRLSHGGNEGEKYCVAVQRSFTPKENGAVVCILTLNKYIRAALMCAASLA